MLVVGLTGDVGAGKSTLLRTWQEQGAVLIDSDEIVRVLWKTGQLRSAARVPSPASIHSHAPIVSAQPHHGVGNLGTAPVAAFPFPDIQGTGVHRLLCAESIAAFSPL